MELQMNNCSQCGQPLIEKESRCPHCNSLNSKIDDILAKEADEIERKSFKGQLKTIYQAENRKQALLAHIKRHKQSLTLKQLFTLFVIFAFIFAMSYVVI